MKLGDLKSNPRNPRKISQKQLELLKNGLDKFGDLSGIVFNKTTGRLISGHQRVKCLPFDLEIKQLKDKPYGYVEHKGERFTIRFVEWDEDTEKAANILANKAGGEFDIPLLTEWLLELDSKNFNLDNTGFTLEEFEDICAPETKDKKEKGPKSCPHCGKEL